jgi:hypothetical protein
MEDDLEHLCKKISLTEGEQIGISVSEGDVSAAKSQGDRCLVGKIWNVKTVNKEAFKTVVSALAYGREGDFQRGPRQYVVV